MAKTSAAEKARSEHRRKVGEDFRRRHPEKAAQERALRNANRAAQRDFGHKVHGTPETHHKASFTCQGALARLFQNGHLSADQLAWAVEIARIHERIGRDVSVGSVSLEARVDQSRSFGGTFFEKLGLVRAEVAYSQWRAWLPRPAPVLALIVEDRALSAVAKRWRMRDTTARRMLEDALDAWPGFNMDACDAVNEGDLLAMQAGLL